jgi:hypothetical protein
MNLSLLSGTSPDGNPFHVLVNLDTNWVFGPVFKSIEQVCDFERYCFGMAPETHRRFDHIAPAKLVELWALYHDAIDAGVWPMTDDEWGTLGISFEDYAEKFSFMKRWNVKPSLSIVETD